MKLYQEKVDIDTSGISQEHFFSIQDTALIMDILRNKMYSNKIMAICREISSNSRDANVEAGHSDKPVTIKLPSAFDLTISFKDDGPGISPDRIENIFIRYGASTKREDNLQIGAFGCGSKTPLSYADNFIVKTIHNHIEYQYSVYIDETKIGKIAKLSETITDANSGTEIRIPVKQKDINEFIDSIEHVTRYWKVKPEIQAGEIRYKHEKLLLELGNCKVFEGETYNYNSSVYVVVAGIPYEISEAHSKDAFISEFIKKYNAKIVFFVNIGDVSLSANREALHFDDPTLKTIQDFFTTFETDLKESISTRLKTYEKYFDAFEYFSSAKKIFKHHYGSSCIISNLTWNGLELEESISISKSYDNSFSRLIQLQTKRSRRGSVKKHRPTASIQSNNYISKNHHLVLDDIDNSQISHDLAFSLATKYTGKYVNILSQAGLEKIGDYKKYIDYSLLSEEIKNVKIIPDPVAKQRKVRLNIFKFVKDRFARSSLAELETDTPKIIMHVYDRNGEKFPSVKYGVNLHAFKNYEDSFVIFGIEENDKTKDLDLALLAKNATSFDEAREDSIDNVIEIDTDKLCSLSSSKSYEVFNTLAVKLNKNHVISTTIKEFSSLKREVEQCLDSLNYDAKRVIQNITGCDSSSKLFGNNKTTFLLKKYPMVSLVTNYYYDEKAYQKLVDYVKLVDASLSDSKAEQDAKDWDVLTNEIEE